MKKILILFMTVFIILSATIPIGALGSPSQNGSYTPPPSPGGQNITASYKLMRSYAEVSSVFVYQNTMSNAGVSDGVNQSLYPTYMFSTPDTIVAPSPNGFGDLDDYLSTNSFYTSTVIKSLSGMLGSIYAPRSTRDIQFVNSGTHGNSYLYSYTLNNGDSNKAYQYGIVAGEWGDGQSTDNIVSGYGIKWSKTASMTVTLMGSISYCSEGGNTITVDIDRNYTVPANQIFYLNPQTLLQYEDTINFDYYVFTGNWTVYSDTAGYLIEYKAYDYFNAESVAYLDGYNEFTDQTYSLDLYPIARISNKLSCSSSGIVPSGTLTVNSAGVHDVTNYQYIDVDIPPFSLYYNGDINNGTYEHEQKWQGVEIDILMDIGNTFERGSSVDISGNGDTNVGRYEFANVDVPQTVIDDVNAFDWLFGAVNGFLEMEILPNFSIGGILLFAAGLALLIWILKIFLGG